MQNSTEISLTAYDEQFLDLSWEWLNDPEIKLLTNSPDLSRDLQAQWYKGLKTRTDYKVWGIVFEGQNIGVMGLKNITSQEAEYFGYIGIKKFWNRGLSRLILSLALAEAKSLNLCELSLKVTNANGRAIKAYENFGFMIEKEDDTMTYMRLKFPKNDRNEI